VLRETFNWEKLSVIAGLTLRRFYFRIYEGSINGERAAEFLRALRRRLRGRLLVIWDGAAIHRSKPVKAVLTESRGRLWLERLPAYAPELNPVEYLWAHLKEHEIANLLVRTRLGVEPPRDPGPAPHAPPAADHPGLLGSI
jgi:transposase